MAATALNFDVARLRIWVARAVLMALFGSSLAFGGRLVDSLALRGELKPSMTSYTWICSSAQQHDSSLMRKLCRQEEKATK